MPAALRLARRGYTMLQVRSMKCLMVLLLASFAANGCAMKIPTPAAMAKVAVAPDFCATSKPIYISKHDQISDMTARAILEHNLTGRKLCGW